MNKGLQVIGRAHYQPPSPHLILWTSNLVSSSDAQPPSSNSQSEGSTAAISANMPCKRSDCGMFCPRACLSAVTGVWWILLRTCIDKGTFCRKDADNTGRNFLLSSHLRCSFTLYDHHQQRINYTRVWRHTLLFSSLTSACYICRLKALIQRWALFRPARKWW
jgi:hypothetical protein